MVTITYAITAHNEYKELQRLLEQLSKIKRSVDEIVVQLDVTATEEVKEVTKRFDCRVIVFPLNKDFATFKNNLLDSCSKDYIIVLDADEYLSELLEANIVDIVELNYEVDIMNFPRINTVEGLTAEDCQQWGWRMNEKGWVNHPDYQTRGLKNKKSTRWVGKVHERLEAESSSTIAFLPQGCELIHPKTIDKQRLQNKLYSEI